MRIKYALMSSNSDSEYLDFWPIAAAAWLKLGITPVLFYIPDHAEGAPVVPQKLPDTEVHIVPLLPDVNIVLQASLLRYWGSCKYPDDAVIVSDIDLLPLSRNFFIDQLTEVDDDCYVHLRCVKGEHEICGLYNIPGEKVTEIPKMRHLNACWHVGKGSLMSEVLWSAQGRELDWESDCKRTVPYHYVRGEGVSTYTIKDRHPRHGELFPPFNAHGDELYMSARVHLFPRQDIFRYIIHDEQRRFLNRDQWFYETEKLAQGYYSAAHLPRPYSRYKLVIDALLQRRALSSVYGFLFSLTEAMVRLRYRSPERGVFLSYFVLLASEYVFAVIYWCTRWSGAGLLEMHSRRQHMWTRRINPRVAKLYASYKRCKDAVCRLWP